MTEQSDKITATWTPLSDFLKRNPDYRAERVLDGVALAYTGLASTLTMQHNSDTNRCPSITCRRFVGDA